MKRGKYLFLVFFPFFIFSQSDQKSKPDSIFVKDKISITLNLMRKTFVGEYNYYLTIYRNKKIILEDKIFSEVGEIEFEDFNGDGIKDLLIQNASDARSNWTYYLYLYDPKRKSFKKVENFEVIKNPKYNSKYKVIESYVLSGKNYVNLYKIKNDKAIDLNILIYDDESTNFDERFEQELDKLRKFKN